MRWQNPACHRSEWSRRLILDCSAVFAFLLNDARNWVATLRLLFTLETSDLSRTKVWQEYSDFHFIKKITTFFFRWFKGFSPVILLLLFKWCISLPFWDHAEDKASLPKIQEMWNRDAQIRKTLLTLHKCCQEGCGKASCAWARASSSGALQGWNEVNLPVRTGPPQC